MQRVHCASWDFPSTWLDGRVCPPRAVCNIVETDEPDAVTLVIMPTEKLSLHEGGGTRSAPKQVLFALTFDHLGSRLISLFEVLKDGDMVEVKDVCPKDIDFRSVSIQTTAEGDLCVRMDLARTGEDHGL
jgi:hypothetical protein